MASRKYGGSIGEPYLVEFSGDVAAFQLNNGKSADYFEFRVVILLSLGST
ncbi:MAG: hypothetical protein F6K41_25095 [Symploca sp. SIO3E6]|nr:hypothetical protein [Caldora sp. SIO3E6]